MTVKGLESLANFSLCFKSVGTSVRYRTALQQPAWKHAIDKEFRGLKDRKTYEWVRLRDIPKGATILSGQVLCSQKADGTKKCRWVALGNHQIHQVDYFETWAPTPNKVSIRVVIARAVRRGNKVAHIDFTQLFSTPSSRKSSTYGPPSILQGRE
jgi:hypothetical protein